MGTHATAEHLGEADGGGKILLQGQQAAVSYHLIAVREGEAAFDITIEVRAPRDWLLDRGIDREVTLVRENGTEVKVRFENKLGVEDNVSVNLEARERVRGSVQDLTARYPELGPVVEADQKAT